MNIKNNNISEHHCLGCKCSSQNKSLINYSTNYQDDFFNEWNRHNEMKKRICVKCGIKEDKFFMDEFANGMFSCWIKSFCEERCSQMLTIQKQNK